jgi:hypothetical protein
LDKLTPILCIINYFTNRLVCVIKWIEIHSSFVTAAATLAIAGFTLALVCANRKLWKVSLNSLGIAQQAANAAKKSADALPIMERAYVFAQIKLKEKLSTMDGPKNIDILLYLKNYGRTPAIVKDIACHIGIYPKNQVNGDDLTEREKHYPIEAFIGRDEQHLENTKPLYIDDKELLYIAGKSHIIYCFGCVRYMTIFEQEHFHGFCWEYSFPDGKFALSPNEELNYNT